MIRRNKRFLFIVMLGAIAVIILESIRVISIRKMDKAAAPSQIVSEIDYAEEILDGIPAQSRQFQLIGFGIVVLLGVLVFTPCVIFASRKNIIHIKLFQKKHEESAKAAKKYAL